MLMKHEQQQGSKCCMYPTALSLPGFYTPAGVFTIAGLHVFPGYLYFLSHLPAEWAGLPRVLLYTPAVVLGAGRALCFGVEVRTVRRGRWRREGGARGDII